MTTYISLLRGINVSGQKMIRMPDLKNRYEALGFQGVTTYLQSGNVIFQAAEADSASLEAAIHAEIQQAFGFEVEVLLRSVPDLRRVVEENPFVARQADRAALYVTFLERLPAPEPAGALAVPAGVEDEFTLVSREVYLFCPGGYGRTKLNNTFFERKLKMAATTRNWNTVCALLEMAQKS